MQLFPSKQFNLGNAERKPLLIFEKQIMPYVYQQNKTDIQDKNGLKIIWFLIALLQQLQSYVSVKSVKGMLCILKHRSLR